jgi:hypothetical protein
MPIWLAYILAPALLLSFGSTVIIHSESPLIIAASMLVAGLLCAAALHLYTFVMSKFRKDQ